MAKNEVKILVACGSGVATSTIAQEEVKKIAQEAGVPVRILKGTIAEVPAKQAEVDLVVGAFLGLLTRQSISSLLTICMGVAAVMVLIPRMVGIMMEGLSPIGTAANAYMKKKIGEDADVYTGVSFDNMVTASHFGWNPGNLIVSFIHRLIG